MGSDDTHTAAVDVSLSAAGPRRHITFNWLSFWLASWQVGMVFLFSFCTLYSSVLAPDSDKASVAANMDMGARYAMFQVRPPRGCQPPPLQPA